MDPLVGIIISWDKLLIIDHKTEKNKIDGNQPNNKPMEIGKTYSLEEFRKRPLPLKEIQLILKNPEINCLSLDEDVSKSYPVKIISKNGLEKYIYCAQFLKDWTTTHEKDFSPFTMGKIESIKFLDEEDINDIYKEKEKTNKLAKNKVKIKF